MGDVEIITTSDGSHSLFNKGLNETYHSIHGAIQESIHVFIKAGLEYWKSKNDHKDLSILEIGFGTGLNAFLTMLNPLTVNDKIYYESWEAYPLSGDVTEKLNYPSTLGSSEKFVAMQQAVWDRPMELSSHFTIHKRSKDLLAEALEGEILFDIIYYDAFGPSKQPEMWSKEVLQKVVMVMAPGGIFVTYCAKGQVKRDLASLGLTIESLQGPPGKLQMIRGAKKILKLS